MGKNTFERFIFAAIVCFMMVVGMTIFNIYLEGNLGHLSLKGLCAGIGIMYAIALPLEWLLIGRTAKRIAFSITKTHEPRLKNILCISFFIVLGMSASMSLIALALFKGVTPQLADQFLNLWWKNFFVALLLQLLLVGPVARALFLVIFPEKEVAVAEPAFAVQRHIGKDSFRPETDDQSSDGGF